MSRLTIARSAGESGSIAAKLDRIIERSYAAAGPAQQQNVPPRPQPQQKDYGDTEYYKRKKRKNFLDDIFDF